MQPENSPQALPLVVAIYGHDVRIVSRPAVFGASLRVGGRAEREDARGGAQRSPRPGELAGAGALTYDGLHIDTATRVVTYGTLVVVGLRGREYALLTHMAAEPERVWTRHELLRDVWGYRTEGKTRTLDSHASRLRGRLRTAGALGWVVGIRGVGYRLAP